MVKRAKTVMVMGTTSGAGKSFITTALCRWYYRQGLKVYPYKAQNMSNNARVVNGINGTMGEIGSAQYFQALAAGVLPDVRMNPVLLKPERDTASQVILMGQANQDLTSVPWRERSQRLWPIAKEALRELEDECDVLVIEGAGSPAEINLSGSDFVNLKVAEAAQARCLLICDIDRGGAFAHLYGTWMLMNESVRKLLRGFVLNKFRGDESLLAPGPQKLQSLTGVPTIAVLPMQRDHGLPEEDGVFDERATGQNNGLTIAIVTYPRISNLDEFQPLKTVPGVRLVWARVPEDLAGADWVILPGSKHTSGDLNWLKQQGFEFVLHSHVSVGKPLLAICGGLQMCGDYLVDPYGVDGEVEGLHLIGLSTVFASKKTVQRTQICFDTLTAPWEALSGCQVGGYEIHHGQTNISQQGIHPPKAVLPGGIGWQQGSVLVCYIHGMFENPAVLQALFGAQVKTLDDSFDQIANIVDQHFGYERLMSLLN